jgi:hypothetical protein
MKRFGRTLVVVLGLAIIGGMVSLVPEKNATAAGGASVSIVSPLPLPVTGNVTAAVTGSVNVANTSAIPISGSLNVANNTSNPIPTLSVNEPTAQPFVKTLCFSSATQCAGAPGSPTSVFTVPSKTASGASVKRLVVEFVSGACAVPNGNQLTYVTLGGVGEQAPSHFFGLTYAPGSTQVETFGGHQTKIYYDPADTIGMSSAFLTLGSTFTCFGTISGYLATQ